MYKIIHKNRRTLSSAVSLAIALQAPALYAQQKGDKAAMLKLSAEGEAAYGQKRFREAAALFERAWAAQPDPILRKNQMIAWFQVYNAEREQGGEPVAREACGNTIKQGELFVVESNQRGELKLEDQQLAHKLMIQCHQDMAALDIKADKLDDAERHITAAAGLGLKEEALTRNDALRAEMWSKRQALAQANKEVKDPPDEAPDDGVGKTAPPAERDDTLAWALIGVGGAGLLVAGGGLFYGMSARSDFYDTHEQDEAALEYNCDTSPLGRASCLSDAEAMEGSLTTSQILVGVGLGVGLAGVIIGTAFLLAPDEEAAAAPTARVLPAIGPDGAGVTLELRF